MPSSRMATMSDATSDTSEVMTASGVAGYPGRNGRNIQETKRQANKKCKSCDVCRTRKVRCDGVLPRCAMCVRRKETCTYPPDSRYRDVAGRLNRQQEITSSPERDQSGALLETIHEARVVNDSPQDAPHSGIARDHVTHPQPTELSYVGGSVLPCPASRRASQGLNGAHPEGNAHRASSTTEAGGSDVDDDNATDIGVLDLFHEAYRPRRNTVPNIRRAHQTIDDEIQEARLISNTALKRQQETNSLQPGLRHFIDFDGLDPAMATHLLELYWNTCYLTWPFTYRPAIMDSLLHGGPYMNKLLLNALYFSSSLYSDQVGLRPGPGGSSTAGMQFYSRFCHLLIDEADRPSIATAAALLLCGVSLMSRGRPRNCLAHHELARRMAAELECPSTNECTAFDSDRNSNALALEIERETQIRLHRGIFSVGVFIGLYLGPLATATIPEKGHPLGKILDTFEELEGWTPYIDPLCPSDHALLAAYAPMPTYAVSTFTAQVDLFVILLKVLRAFYNEDRRHTFDSSYQMKSEIEGQLSCWIKSLPIHLRFEPGLRLTPPPHQISLLAIFYSVRILNRRPFLERKYLHATFDSQDYRIIEDSCIDDATTIWQLLLTCKEKFSLRRSSLLLSFSAYIAFMVLDRSSANDTASAARAKSLWAMLLELRDGPNPGFYNLLATIGHRVYNFRPIAPESSGVETVNTTDIILTSVETVASANPRDLSGYASSQSKATTPSIARTLDDSDTSILAPLQDLHTVANNMVSNTEPRISDDIDDKNEISRFVNIWCPRSTEGYPIWMLSAAEMAETKPLLRDTLMAISKLFFGIKTGNIELEKSGQRLHIGVLGSVQQKLNSTINTSTELLLTVILLSMIELYRRRDESSLDCHWMASLAILKARGPLRHMSDIGHILFTDLRLHWTIRSLRLRQSTFLAREEWKFIPWRGAHSRKDALQHLLDHVLEIPGLLELYDQYNSIVAAGNLAPSDIMSMRKHLSAWTDALSSRLDQWKLDYVGTRLEDQQTDAPEADTLLPAFRCWNPSKTELITPKALQYPDIILAASFCMYNATQLLLATVQISSTTNLQAERYLYACNICRSVSYFFQYAPEPLIIRIIYPLRIAYDNFEEGSVEQQFVKDVAKLIGKQQKFKYFSSQLG